MKSKWQEDRPGIRDRWNNRFRSVLGGAYDERPGMERRNWRESRKYAPVLRPAPCRRGNRGVFVEPFDEDFSCSLGRTRWP